jgi:hypothetical protein
MLFVKPLFGFAASTSTLTVLMVPLGQVGRGPPHDHRPFIPSGAP